MGHDKNHIVSALQTQAPAPELAGRVGCAHWKDLCTVYTETGETFLVTGYNNKKPYLTYCKRIAAVELNSIYDVIDRDHPAVWAMGLTNMPHCHYTGT